MQSAPVLALIIALPLLGALLAAWNRNTWSRRAIAISSSTMVFGAFVATVIALIQLSGAEGQVLGFELVRWGPWGDIDLSLGLLGDPISLWWSIVVTGVGFLIHVYSAGYMKDDPGFGRYFAKLNYFVFAMSLLVLADNYIFVLIGWANVGVASFMLIGFWNYKPEAASAAMKAFIMNAIGEVGLILANVLIFVNFGTFKFDGVFNQVSGVSTEVLTAIGLLLLVAAVAKSAQLPLHTWLPDAMQGPTAVSALIHAATMVTAGVYLVTRSHPIYLGSETAMQAVAWVGGLSALFGALVALRQTDIKRVLAFSTMSQVGYMMLAAGVGAYTAAMFHFMTHAFFKALLFLAAGIIIHYLNGEQDLRKMGGLGRKMPAVYWMSLIGVVAIAGIPPLAGFFSKEEILHAVHAEGLTFLYFLGIVVGGMTAFYMFRLFALTFAGESYEERAQQTAYRSGKKNRRTEQAQEAVHHPAGPEMLIPVGVLTVLSVIGGWISIPGLTSVPQNFLGTALGRYTEWHAHAMSYGPELILILAIAIAGAALALYQYGPQGAWRRIEIESAEKRSTGLLATGFYLDSVYQTLVVRPVLGISGFIANWTEPKVVDGAVNGLARLVQITGDTLRRWHAGLVRRYALVVFVGVAGVLAYVLLMF